MCIKFVYIELYMEKSNQIHTLSLVETIIASKFFETKILNSIFSKLLNISWVSKVLKVLRRNLLVNTRRIGANLVSNKVINRYRVFA